MDYPRFSTDQAARAAGLTPSALANWIKRLGNSMIRPDSDDEAPDRVFLGTGRARLFKRKTVMRIAIMAQVARMGLPLEFAHHCATTFIDVGSGGAAYGSEPVEIDRAPGGFFQDGGTALLIKYKPDGETVAEIVRMRDVNLDLLRGNVVSVVDLEALHANVDASLTR